MGGHISTSYSGANMRGYVDVGGLAKLPVSGMKVPVLFWSLPRPQVASLDTPTRVICNSYVVLVVPFVGQKD